IPPIYAGLQLEYLKEDLRGDRSGREVYIEECRKQGIVPQSRVLEQIGLPEACFANLLLGHKGGIAVAKCLEQNSITQSLIMSGSGLTPRGTLPVVAALGCNTTLTRIDLSKNILDVAAMETLANAVDPSRHPCQAVQEIVLDRCTLEDRGVCMLMKAMGRHQKLLTLVMSGNAISDSSCHAIGNMLTTNTTLTHLDLSWNNIKANGSMALAQGLTHNKTLLQMNLAWNGLETHGGVAMGQMMHVNCGLTMLDLSATRVTPEAIMVLSEGIKQNTTLLNLQLNDNPLGYDGGRHLMQALQENDVLEVLGLQGVSFSKGTAAGLANFNSNNPDGEYTLNLADPVQRAVAAQLCALETKHPGSWRRFQLNGRSMQFSGQGSMSFASLDFPTSLPTSGSFDLLFKANLGAPADEHVIDKEDLDNMLGQLANPRGSDFHRLDLVRMFAAGHHFTCAQAAQLLSTFGFGDEKVHAALYMFARVVDVQHLAGMLAGFTVRERKGVLRLLGVYRFFNSLNPTGHYCLNLAVEAERMIATKLCDLGSRDGHHKNWRNVKYEQRIAPVLNTGFTDWLIGLPEHGKLAVDYTSYHRPPPKTTPMSSLEWHAFLGMQHSDRESGTPLEDQVMQLKGEVIHLNVTCDQVIQLLGRFKESDDRVEVVVTFFNRIVDMDNFYRVLYALNVLEQGCIVTRLGVFNAVPNLLHCSLHFCLDCSNPEHQDMAKQLVRKAVDSRSKDRSF
ncbi:hypothetical protein CYMTET_15393, partial [Cymbomonas tetramitiformis]